MPLKVESEFKYCPAFAQFLLQTKAEEFASAQLKFIKQNGISFSKCSIKELLEALAENKITNYIKTLIASSNQLQHNNTIVTEYVAEFVLVLRKICRDFLPYYTRDVNVCIGVMEEIDEVCNELKASSENNFYHHNKINNQQLIQNAPDAVIAIDDESKILVWNPKCEEIFGWKAEEITGMTLTNTIIPPVYRESHKMGMRRLLTTGEAKVLNKTLELTALNKWGEEFHISLTISKAESEGKPMFIAFIRDISKEKETQTELQNKSKELAELNRFLEQKNLELETTNKELESFNYIISHDLQEPLRKIQVFTSRLLNNYTNIKDDERDIIIERINVSAARLNQLISDLLSFTLLNRTKEDKFELIDLNSLIQEILSDYQTIIDERKASLHIEKLPVIKGMRLQIHQLFQNLISNAIKYAHPERKLEMHIQSKLVQHGEVQKIAANVMPVSYYKITITDNGIGFEEQYSERIFRLFQRLHSNEEYPGTGIGLAICKRVTDYHKGFIKVHSQPQTGTSFDIYLPILE